MFKKVRGIFLMVTVGGLVSASPSYASVWSSANGNSVSVGVSTPASYGARGRKVDQRRPSDRPPPCTYTLLTNVDDPTIPSIPPGQFFTITCLGENLNLVNPQVVYVPFVTGHDIAAPTVMDTAATQAADSISLPPPSIQMNPASFSVVGLATWLWIDPAQWRSYTATASTGGVTASAVATPQTVTWDMGNGQSIACAGPGTPYDGSTSGKTSSCSYTYKESSAGQPSVDSNPNDASYLVTATMNWTVTWSVLGSVGGGTLPDLETYSALPVRVEQVESIGSRG
jgi:hypothetical protein